MYVVIYTFGLLCFLAGTVLSVYSQVSRYQAEIRHKVEEMRARGDDPDRAFLGAIARIQASERHRWRSPVQWISIKYVKLTRRRFTGR